MVSSNIKSGNIPEQSCKTEVVYHLGIIDWLQSWNLKKRAERLSKSLISKEYFNSISAVPPEQYHPRFCRFLQRHVFAASNDFGGKGQFIKNMKRSL